MTTFAYLVSVAYAIYSYRTFYLGPVDQCWLAGAHLWWTGNN